MADDLLLPQVPEPKPDDPEDVSWALSTAEAMWARGDHSEGIKWVRRAAEAASEAEDDSRALELAKVAADLTNLIARMSRAPAEELTSQEINVEPFVVPGPPPVPRGAPPVPPSNKVSPASVTKPVTTPSRPPPGLPSKAAGTPLTGPKSTAPRPFTPSPTPNATSAKSPPSAPPKKGKRKSKENLEGEAQAAGVLDTSPHAVVDPETMLEDHRLLASDTTEVAAVGDRVEAPIPDPRLQPRRLDPAEATVVKSMAELVKESRLIEDSTGTPRTTDEWDASPTQNLTGDDLAMLERSDRATAVGAAPPSVQSKAPAPPPVSSTRTAKSPSGQIPAVRGSSSASRTVDAMRPPSPTQHDPEIVTTQAVRVVVWRDATGVHVAPAGTRVSAITVDAVLVALDGAADLTAWLSQRDR